MVTSFPVLSMTRFKKKDTTGKLGTPSQSTPTGGSATQRQRVDGAARPQPSTSMANSTSETRRDGKSRGRPFPTREGPKACISNEIRAAGSFAAVHHRQEEMQARQGGTDKCQ